MKRLLIDCDGVLSDWLTPALAVVEEMCNAHYVPADFDSWDIFARFAADGHDARALKDAIYGRVDLRDLPVYPGAQEAVAALRERAEVYVVSSAWDVPGRIDWLRRHFDMPHTSLVYAVHKHIVKGDVFVDDHAGNVTTWSAAWPEGRAILYGQPYNASAAGWPEVLAALEVP